MTTKEQYQNNKEYYTQYRKDHAQHYKDKYRLNIKENKVVDAKRRAKAKNVPFNLTTQYIKDIWPKDNICPALGIPFTFGGHVTKNYSSAALDRIIPSKGYVKGNVQIVSGLANSIMSNATPDQVIQAGQYFKKIIEDLNNGTQQ